jgi:hypothetical protein
MAFMQLARIYTCSNCGWKKIVPPHSDVLTLQDIPPEICAKCGSAEIKGRVYETFGSKLRRWLHGRL